MVVLLLGFVPAAPFWHRRIAVSGQRFVRAPLRLSSTPMASTPTTRLKICPVGARLQRWISTPTPIAGTASIAYRIAKKVDTEAPGTAVRSGW